MTKFYWFSAHFHIIHDIRYVFLSIKFIGGYTSDKAMLKVHQNPFTIYYNTIDLSSSLMGGSIIFMNFGR